MPPLLHRQAEAGGHRWAGRALRAPLRPAGQEVANERLDQLRAVKLRALVTDHLDKGAAVAAAPSVLPGGAGLLSPAEAGSQAWVLIDDSVVERFGAALAWATRAGAKSLDVLVQDEVPAVGGASSVVARRAAEFSQPAIRVWSISGRDLMPAEAAGAPPSDPSPDAALVALLSAHGAEPVVEHGVLRGEVLGLEVARVVAGHLEVGVGRHDRMARAEMRPYEDAGSALDEAVGAVLARRRPDVPRHPANTLARSRWLRSVVCSDPSVLGLASLRPVAPPLPWFDLPEAGAAPAVGRSLSGDSVVAVFSVGVDLDLVPTAADARAIYDPPASLVVVVPEGDDLPVTRGLAASLRRPAEVRTVPRSWASAP